MKFKIFIISILCILSNNSLFSEPSIREKIAIVEVSLNEVIKDKLLQAANYYQNNGSQNKAEWLNNISRGRYGSGFIVRSDTNELFLITNRHVVEFADEISISFENSMETILEIDESSILYLPANFDLALVKVKNNKTILDSFVLPLNTEQLVDGQEIWAAGYPGIDGKPVWQLSKGVITNHNVNINNLFNDSQNYLIQHSAPVDPGNSGGPLLRKDKNGVFSVSGVNTWKVTGRSNTNFSIPSETITTIIQEYFNNNFSDDKEDSLLKKCTLFLSFLKSEDFNQEYSSFISEKLIEKHGFSIYVETLKSLHPDARKKLEKSFYFESALETMKEASSYKLYNMTKADENHNWTIDTINLSEHDNIHFGKTVFSTQKTTLEIDWIYEYGVWKIINFSGCEKITDASLYFNNKPIQSYQISGNNFYFRCIYPLRPEIIQELGGNFGFGYSYDYEIIQPSFLNIGIEIGAYKNTDVVLQNENEKLDVTVSGLYGDILGGIGISFPIDTEETEQTILSFLALGGAKFYYPTTYSYDNYMFQHAGTLDAALHFRVKSTVELRPRSGMGMGYGGTISADYTMTDLFNDASDFIYKNIINISIGAFIKV